MIGIGDLQAIVSGSYRTGSTFAYIVLVEIFKHVYGDFLQDVRLNEEIQRFNDYGPAAFKSHDYFPGDREFKIIHTVRNPFDVLSSLKKNRPALPDYMAEVKAIILRDIEFEKYRKYENSKDVLILKYSDFFDNELNAINRIIDFLGVEYPYAERLANRQNHKHIKAVTDLLEPGNPTPYTAFHISDDPSPGNYINYLDKDEIKELKDFLFDLDTV